MTRTPNSFLAHCCMTSAARLGKTWGQTERSPIFVDQRVSSLCSRCSISGEDDDRRAQLGSRVPRVPRPGRTINSAPARAKQKRPPTKRSNQPRPSAHNLCRIELGSVPSVPEFPRLSPNFHALVLAASFLFNTNWHPNLPSRFSRLI